MNIKVKKNQIPRYLLVSVHNTVFSYKQNMSASKVYARILLWQSFSTAICIFVVYKKFKCERSSTISRIILYSIFGIIISIWYVNGSCISLTLPLLISMRLYLPRHTNNIRQQPQQWKNNDAHNWAFIVFLADFEQRETTQTTTI